MTLARSMVAALMLLLAACQPGVESPEKPALPDEPQAQPWAGIAPTETVHFTGTEPFWGGEVSQGTLTWKTPENQTGNRIPVERFAGRNGLGFNGILDGAHFDLAVSEGQCSDGMSDRTYPFAVTVRRGAETLRGCGWTDRRPAIEARNP
jgi:uncharacterized membrane protein